MLFLTQVFVDYYKINDDGVDLTDAGCNMENQHQTEGSTQHCHNSYGLKLELRQCCVEPSKFNLTQIYTSETAIMTPNLIFLMLL